MSPAHLHMTRNKNEKGSIQLALTLHPPPLKKMASIYYQAENVEITIKNDQHVQYYKLKIKMVNVKVSEHDIFIIRQM